MPGDALLLLMPHEDSYVDFLGVRKVPLRPATPAVLGTAAADGAATSARLRAAAEADRAFMEAGVKAFVSYVRGYKEHHCRYIFRIQVGEGGVFLSRVLGSGGEQRAGQASKKSVAWESRLGTGPQHQGVASSSSQSLHLAEAH